MNSEGIGLGLFISKRLVEANGGELRCESQGMGQGSQFSFVMEMEQSETHSLNKMKQRRIDLQQMAFSQSKKRKGLLTHLREERPEVCYPNSILLEDCVTPRAQISRLSDTTPVRKPLRLIDSVSSDSIEGGNQFIEEEEVQVNLVNLLTQHLSPESHQQQPLEIEEEFKEEENCTN